MGMSQRIAKGALLRMDAAELIDFVARTGLTEISSWSAQDLVDIGWMESVSSKVSLFGLYGITSAGLWTPIVNASGLVTEANSTLIYSNVRMLPNQSGSYVTAPSTTATSFAYKGKRIDQIPINTNAGGESLVVDLHTGPAGYYPVVRLKRIISNVADAATNLAITVSGGALLGPASQVINLQANIQLDLGDQLFYDLTDATVIRAQLTAGPVNGTIWLEIEYWSES